MLSKEVKEAILNGAYGMTRDGRKVKYLGETINKSYPLGFITVPDKISHIKPYNGIDVIFSTEDTWKGTLEDVDHQCDIVGLWVEPTQISYIRQAHNMLQDIANKLWEEQQVKINWDSVVFRYCLKE